MACEQCTSLIVRYRIATAAYKAVVSNMRGALEDDFTVVMSRVKDLYAECETARDSMNDHWVACHDGDRSPPPISDIIYVIGI
jgi:hypothetical protein